MQTMEGGQWGMKLCLMFARWKDEWIQAHPTVNDLHRNVRQATLSSAQRVAIALSASQLPTLMQMVFAALRSAWHEATFQARLRAEVEGLRESIQTEVRQAHAKGVCRTATVFLEGMPEPVLQIAFAFWSDACTKSRHKAEMDQLQFHLAHEVQQMLV